MDIGPTHGVVAAGGKRAVHGIAKSAKSAMNGGSGIVAHATSARMASRFRAGSAEA